MLPPLCERPVLGVVQHRRASRCELRRVVFRRRGGRLRRGQGGSRHRLQHRGNRRHHRSLAGAVEPRRHRALRQLHRDAEQHDLPAPARQPSRWHAQPGLSGAGRSGEPDRRDADRLLGRQPRRADQRFPGQCFAQQLVRRPRPHRRPRRLPLHPARQRAHDARPEPEPHRPVAGGQQRAAGYGGVRQVQPAVHFPAVHPRAGIQGAVCGPGVPPFLSRRRAHAWRRHRDLRRTRRRDRPRGGGRIGPLGRCQDGGPVDPQPLARRDQQRTQQLPARPPRHRPQPVPRPGLVPGL